MVAGRASDGLFWGHRQAGKKVSSKFRKNFAKLTVLSEQQEYITSLENFNQI
jgi:hypothetical protein